MPPRHQLLHSWTSQLQSLLADLRVTRVRGLALLSLGLLWAETTALGRIAASLPLPVQDLSTERRLRRFLANRQIAVVPTWQVLLRAFLARYGQREVVLVFDPTPHQGAWTILMLGIVMHRRTLPVAWHIVPQQTSWPHSTWRYLERLGRRVNAALPAGTRVTLVADRGLTSAALLDLCQRLGWHACLRLTVTPRSSATAQLVDGTTTALWRLACGCQGRWDGPVALFQAQGWRTVWLTVRWRRGADEPLVLVSDRPAGRARLAEYRQRVHCEAFYLDTKSRGWRLEASGVRDRNRLNRLWLALAVAAWWVMLLGQQVIRRGLRQRFDRRDRRDLSLCRLGRRWIAWLLDHGHCPPLPFRLQLDQWVLRWAP